MKTKQLGFFACMVAVVLVMGLSTSKIYGKDKKPHDDKVFILECTSFGPGVTTVFGFDTNLDPASPILEPGGPLDSGTPCSEAVAFLLNNKFKIEGTNLISELLLGFGRTRTYTMVSKK